MTRHNEEELLRKQQECLEATIERAEQIPGLLQRLKGARHGEVHFRPSSGGIAMVGLHLDRPQRGKSGIRDLDALVRNFDATFSRHCIQPQQGRLTAEKRLQSFLIADAYRHAGRMQALNDAARQQGQALELSFVTDELALPLGKGKIVCDVLGYRPGQRGRVVPVVLELKSARAMQRLKKQVNEFAVVMNLHAGLFERLYSALRGDDIRFEAPAEKWILWPAARNGETDPRVPEFASAGIRVISYGQDEKERFCFHIG